MGFHFCLDRSKLKLLLVHSKSHKSVRILHSVLRLFYLHQWFAAFGRRRAHAAAVARVVAKNCIICASI